MYSFEPPLLLTGRGLPHEESVKSPAAVIERKTMTTRKLLQQHCYHHHIADPTKVVELDPLPNNSSNHESVMPRWQRALSAPDKEMKQAKLKKTGLGQVPIIQSASLEEKLDEITNRWEKVA